MTDLQQFTGQNYLNLETYRKNGIPVETPVWFVMDGGTIYVRTIANSGKVKRIRRCAEVNIAPCKMDGTLLSNWIPAKAREITDELTAKKVDHLLDRKYGLQKKMFGLFTSLRGQKDTILEVKPG